MIGFAYYINAKKVPLKLEQNIEKISIRDGNNGKIVETTRNEDINIILYQINSLNLEKKYKRADYTGWEIILDIYYKNKERPELIVIRHNGEQPAKKFILSLDKKMIAKMLDTIKLLQDNGYQLREPYSKHIDDGIFELRAKVGSNISRVLYFFYVGQNIILTNDFIKKTQKTPSSEIEKAKKYRIDYIQRKEN